MISTMIRQFDVFLTPFRNDTVERPYYVVVQSDRYQTLSRVCVPFIAERFLRPDGRLNPRFELEGKGCFLHPIELLSMPTALLRSKIANLEADRYRIVSALDLVFTGV
jgi:CcdB protein